MPLARDVRPVEAAILLENLRAPKRGILEHGFGDAA
jgi:hypothetical protein